MIAVISVFGSVSQDYRKLAEQLQQGNRDVFSMQFLYNMQRRKKLIYSWLLKSKHFWLFCKK